jgi:hypothetical protein
MDPTISSPLTVARIAQNTDEYLAKVDFNIGKHHLSGHYFQMNYTDPVFIPPSSNLLELRGDAEHLVLKNVSVVDIYTISPTFLLSSFLAITAKMAPPFPRLRSAWPMQA